MDQVGTMASQESIVSELHGVKTDISLELGANSIVFVLISLISFSVPNPGNYSPEHSLVLDVFSRLKTPPKW